MSGRLVPSGSESHVSLADGKVRCVGFKHTDETGDTLENTVYCWDMRLPTGNQVVKVSGATHKYGLTTWTWADKYLVVVGKSDDADIELMWADLSVPSSSPAFTKLHDNPDGSSFPHSNAKIRNVAALSDDLLCWLADVGRDADSSSSNDHMHCFSLSAGTIYAMDEPLGMSWTSTLTAVAVNGTVYVNAGQRNSLWAWQLANGTVSKLEDMFPGSDSLELSSLAAISDEVGVAFGFRDTSGRNESVAVTWKAGHAPVPIDGYDFSAGHTDWALFGSLLSGDLTPWNDDDATFRVSNVTASGVATLVLVDRTTGFGRILPGAERAHVGKHQPMHAMYETMDGGEAHGILFYMKSNAMGSTVPEELYFYSFTEDLTAVQAASTVDHGLESIQAGIDEHPFATVTDTITGRPRTALAITPFRRWGGDELLVFRPADVAVAGARVPSGEAVFNPSPTFSGDGSSTDSAFTRGTDGALCMMVRNTTVTDFACIVGGPRAVDSAVLLDFASEMPLHPLVDPDSEQAFAYSH